MRIPAGHDFNIQFLRGEDWEFVCTNLHDEDRWYHSYKGVRQGLAQLRRRDRMSRREEREYRIVSRAYDDWVVEP